MWLQGFTLEEMDDIFDSGVPAWKTRVKKSRLDEIEHEIATGNVKLGKPFGNDPDAVHRTDDKPSLEQPAGTHEENGNRV